MKKNFILREWLLSENNNGFVLEHIWKLIYTDKSAFEC
jgi:hypothetical protein